MSVSHQKLVAPYWKYTLPPGGLSEYWDEVYRVLANPIATVIMLRGLHDPGKSARCNLPNAWAETLSKSEFEMSETIAQLHGRARRVWEVATKIENTIRPITVACKAAAGQIGPPWDYAKPEDLVNVGLWKKLGRLLQEFDEKTHFDELAEAIAFENDNQDFLSPPVAIFKVVDEPIGPDQSLQVDSTHNVVVSKRGRPPKYDPKDDRLMLDEYQALQSEGISQSAFEEMKNLELGWIEKAQSRVRDRKNRAKKAK